jgi:hypothetical protein
MCGKLGKLWLVGVLSLLLMPATKASASGLFDGWFGKKCPPPSYSPCHYWVPAVDRVYAFYCHRPLQYIYPPDNYPMIPLNFQPVRYPCPPVDTAIFTANYPWFPKPPGTSTTRAPATSSPDVESDALKAIREGDPAPGGIGVPRQ